MQDSVEDSSMEDLDETHSEAQKLIRLKEKYGRKYKCNQEMSDDVWQQIAVEGKMRMDAISSKKRYYQLYNSYKKIKYQAKFGSSLEDHKDWSLFQCFEEIHREFEMPLCDLAFVVENFDRICRFCLTNSETSRLRAIFDDSTDESTADSYDFLEMLDGILNEPGSHQIDYKLSNLVCEGCFELIENLNSFKKQCEKSASLLQDAKLALEAKLSFYAEKSEIPLKDNIIYLEANTTNYSSNIEEDIKNICEEPFSEDNENDYSNDDHTHKISNAESSELSEEETSNKLKKNKIYLKLHEGVEKLEQNSEPSSGSELDGETIKEPKKKRSKKSTMEKFSEKNDNKGERARSQCSICGKLYVELSAHMRIHTNDKKYRCHLCEKGFCQSGQLTRHINSHLNIRKYKCPINECGKSFVDPSSLPKHMVVHNKDSKKFVCRICGATFPRMASWKHHEQSHRQEKNFSCDICSKTFAFKQYLKKHYVLHSGVLPHKCPYCQKRFATSKNINVHIRTHTKETPYQCPICSSAYSYRSTLKSHMAKVHNQVPTPNASLLRQPPDEKDSTLKQIPNISEGSLCNQEASSLKESPRDNFNDLRMHPNYSLQQTSSRQDESVDGSNENMNSSYQTVQIGSRISHDEQNIGIY